MSENFIDFSSDKVDIYLILVDNSGSMENEEGKVKRGLKRYKQEFENFPERGSIAVSISMFSDSFKPSPFRRIDEMDTGYYTGGMTALHYSIVKGIQFLQSYIEEIIDKKGYTPNAFFILLSDGHPCQDSMTFEDAKKEIEKANFAGITTIFVAFGDAISSKYGEEIGFMVTKDVDDRDAFEDFCEELSESCKEQSKSLKALGKDFFSKATRDQSSSEYSNKAGQSLEDDSWFDDI